MEGISAPASLILPPLYLVTYSAFCLQVHRSSTIEVTVHLVGKVSDKECSEHAHVRLPSLNLSNTPALVSETNQACSLYG